MSKDGYVRRPDLDHLLVGLYEAEGAFWAWIGPAGNVVGVREGADLNSLSPDEVGFAAPFDGIGIGDQILYHPNENASDGGSVPVRGIVDYIRKTEGGLNVYDVVLPTLSASGNELARVRVRETTGHIVLCRKGGMVVVDGERRLLATPEMALEIQKSGMLRDALAKAKADAEEAARPKYSIRKPNEVFDMPPTLVGRLNTEEGRGSVALIVLSKDGGRYSYFSHGYDVSFSGDWAVRHAGPPQELADSNPVVRALRRGSEDDIVLMTSAAERLLEASRDRLAVLSRDDARFMEVLQHGLQFVDECNERLTAELKQIKFSKETVTIPLSRGTADVLGFSAGCLFVHKSLNGRGYTVTHRETGSILVDEVDSLAAAKMIACRVLRFPEAADIQRANLSDDRFAHLRLVLRNIRCGPFGFGLHCAEVDFLSVVPVDGPVVIRASEEDMSVVALVLGRFPHVEDGGLSAHALEYDADQAGFIVTPSAEEFRRIAQFQKDFPVVPVGASPKAHPAP